MRKVGLSVKVLLCGSLIFGVACATSGEAVRSDEHAKAMPAWWHSSITFQNHAKTPIHHIFLSPWDHESWGPDQLGHETLEPGGQFSVYLMLFV
jgi:hypothetical protein